ncbi:MAG: hypothetical protein RLZZ419_2094 [Pseudomonadota bacterium]|jgi:hypothetical protein
MKKLFFLIQLCVVVILYPMASYADDDGRGWQGYGYENHEGGHHGYHGHHREHYYPQPQVNYYYAQPQVRYYPQPPVRYYRQPQAEYYPQQPQRYQDSRSTQGLAGGVIGSVFGYQMGSGDPVMTGLGAAAGSYLGNGMAGGR